MKSKRIKDDIPTKDEIKKIGNMVPHGKKGIKLFHHPERNLKVKSKKHG